MTLCWKVSCGGFFLGLTNYGEISVGSKVNYKVCVYLKNHMVDFNGKLGGLLNWNYLSSLVLKLSNLIDNSFIIYLF